MRTLGTRAARAAIAFACCAALCDHWWARVLFALFAVEEATFAFACLTAMRVRK